MRRALTLAPFAAAVTVSFVAAVVADVSGGNHDAIAVAVAAALVAVPLGLSAMAD